MREATGAPSHAPGQAGGLRRALLELARRIVVEEGPAGVSAARLAREAPAPLPVVTRNFRTRAAILAALRADLVDGALAEIEAGMPGLPPRHPLALETFCRLWTAYWLDRPHLFRAAFLSGDGGLAGEPLMERLRPAFGTQMSAGAVEERCELLACALHGLIQSRLDGRTGAAEPGELAALASAALRGATA